MEQEPPSVPDRRHARRRQYNRRQSDEPTAPPYFETFVRIAEALEGIEDLLRHGGAVVLPDGDDEEPPVVPVHPRGEHVQER